MSTTRTQKKKLSAEQLNAAMIAGLVLYLSPQADTSSNIHDEFPFSESTSPADPAEFIVIDNKLVGPLGRLLRKLAKIGKTHQLECSHHLWRNDCVIVPFVPLSWLTFGESNSGSDKLRFRGMVDDLKTAAQHFQNESAGTKSNESETDKRPRITRAASEAVIAIVASGFAMGVNENENLPLPEKPQLAITRRPIAGQRRNVTGVITGIYDDKRAILIDLNYLVLGARIEDFRIGEQVSFEIQYLDQIQKIECVNLVPQMPLT